MTYSEIKHILQQSYSLDNFKKILNDIFPQSDKYFSTNKELFQEHEKVNTGFQFGNITLADGKSIALFDVEVADSINITKNRKGLRDIAIKYIDNGIINGALVAFHSPNKADYRLSFMTKQAGFTEEGDFVTTQTAPKRYTFILGKNESCTTAAKRLAELKEKVSATGLQAVIDAFSVEKLNKEFFKGYKEHYEKFWKYINSQPNYREKLIDKEQTLQDKAEKPIRDFAKKLLGRIVFLYFLQKKGWMGIPADRSDWQGGDPNFIKNFFQNTSDKSKFYSTNLIELFYNTLNQVRKNDIFHLTATKVPYLNGGLFDNDSLETNHFDFPESYFSELFDFFDQFNFTIDENDPDDANVGIDPEMLGHIFENLLEENQNKTGGIFYTPKAIVQYMCQESLIQYLKTHLEANETPSNNEIEGDISAFIRQNDRGKPKGFITQNAKKIEELLDKVKICDPAIGSGAFPMGMLQEIFKAKMTLDLTLDPAETKRHIIQNSIYGVDLERGAVDIARLRFWLALVVDEDEPSPLPNLDYKIMQGNSLLESFEGIELSKIHQQSLKMFEPQRDLFGNFTDPQTTIFQSQKTEGLQKEIEEYFSVENLERKKILRKKISQAVHEHIEYNIELRERNLDRRITEAGNPANLKPKVRKQYDQLLAERQQISQSRQRLHELQDRTERPYFLWHLFFKDVFEQGGFDIVIGNPPYIQLQNDGGYLAKLFENEGFDTFERTGDIYALFYEQGFKCLQKKGILCYITSNKWMRAGYGESLRKFFVQKTNPIVLIDFAGQKIFENATVDTNILLFAKTSNTRETKTCIVKEKVYSIADYLAAHNTVSQFTNADSWVILSPIEQSIKQKIERIGTPLKDWNINIYRGILTGLNEAFIIDGKKKDELINADPKSAEIIRPILRGRDIKRYGYDFADLWLINTHNGIKEKGISPININDYPAIKEHLDLSYTELEKRTDKGETPYNLRNCAYIEDFSKSKIMWAETMRIHKNTYNRFPRFSLELNECLFTDKSCFFATGKDLKLIVAILNSKLGKYLCNQTVSILDDGGYLMQKIYIEKIPIKKLNDTSEINRLVDLLINDNTNEVIENRIDSIVYEMYELNHSEIQFIESQ